jgi:hypothetical protein
MIVTLANILQTDHIDDGREVLQSVIDLIKSLDLNIDQMRFLSNELLSSIDPSNPELFRLLTGAQYLITGAPPNGAAVGEVLGPLVDLARPLEKDPASLRPLLNFGASVLETPGIQSVLAYGRTLWAQQPEPEVNALEDAISMDKVVQAVKNTECRHCTSAQLNERALEVINDFNNSRNNWEADPTTNRPYASYTNDEFKAALDPVLERLGNPAESAPEETAMQALLDFMKARTSQDVSSWLMSRSQDYTLIGYRYPGQDNPVVKVVSTLDRYELVLIDADFAPLGEDYALKFVQAMAEAWGDEPDRKKWPAQIQQWYPEGSGKTPPTLKQAVASMRAELNEFALVKDAPDLNVFGLNLQDIKRRIYNLGQVLPSLESSVPGTPGLKDEGLELLRDLFWEIESSTPLAYRNDKGGARNNFQVMLGLARLGIFHHLGHELRKFRNSPTELNQLTDAFVQGAGSPQAAPVFATLLSPASQRKLVWALMDQVFAVLDGSSPPASDDPIVAARMKQLGAYVLADAANLQLVDGVLGVLPPILQQDTDFLIAHADLLGDVLRSARVSYLVRAFGDDNSADTQSERALVKQIIGSALNDSTLGVDLLAVAKNVDADAAAKNSWDLFNSRLTALEATSDFKSLNLSQIETEILDYLSGKTPDASQSASRLIQYTAERLQSKGGLSHPGDLEDYLILARDKPDDFNRVLETLGHYNDNGDIQNFLMLVRRSLSSADK